MKQILPLLMLLFCSWGISAQSLIKGMVLDEMGGVPNVNISIKNSEKGTITNAEGSFEVFAKVNDTLLISHVGYQPEEIVLGEDKILNITLSDRVSLDEVVIIALPCKMKCGTSGCYWYEKIKEKEDLSISKSYKLYPNPSSNGIFNLNLDKKHTIVEFQVTSITGQIVLSKTIQNSNENIKIDLSQYAAGLYLINTIADGKYLPTKKAIVR